MLMGLLPPDSGRAAILGEDCWSAAIALRHRVGYVPEKPRFYDWMTVREIGWFTSGFHRAGFLGRYLDLAGHFHLDPAARPSGNGRQPARGGVSPLFSTHRGLTPPARLERKRGGATMMAALAWKEYRVFRIGKRPDLPGAAAAKMRLPG
jgi:hypothetical protein